MTRQLFITAMLATIPCVAEQPTPTTEAQIIQIVFVPQKQLSENRIAGTLKENIFYWSNPMGNPKLGRVTAEQPKAGETIQHQFLQVLGAPVTPGKRGDSVVTLLRAFNMPEGKTKVELKTNLRVVIDEWAPNASPPMRICKLKYCFLKPGKATQMISLSVIPPQNQGWRKNTTPLNIPTGATQLIVAIQTDGDTPLQISEININFP